MDGAIVVQGSRCGSCDRVNTARAKFCNFCGVRLDAAEPAPLAPPAPELIKNEFAGTLDESGNVLPPKVSLIVSIIGAKNLRPADVSFRGSSSDPYCTCELCGRPETQVRTRHIERTLRPEWNEEHEILDYVLGEDLSFVVYDHDRGSEDDVLGRLLLSSTLFSGPDGFEGDLPLTDCGEGYNPTLKLRVQLQIVHPAPPISVDGSRLRVAILSATDLRAADWALGGGSSDPFCSCQIAGKDHLKVETKHKSKTLAPVWDEVFEIEEYLRGDNLEFTVWDYDRGSAADSLGHALLDFGLFDREGGFEGELRLKDCGSGHSSKLKVRVEVLPPLLADQPPVSQPGSRLRVVMHGATGLRAADWALMGAGSSDPFCTCEILGRPGFKVETEHVSKTLAPTWNEEHFFPLYSRGEVLEFRVFDYDRGSSADLLGRATLAPRNFDREGGFEGELRLLESGKGSQAKLRVSVEVLLPLMPPALPKSESGSRLQISVVSAKGLPAADFSLMGAGSSDPFCVCEIEGKPELKIETKYVSKSLNPVWNETHEMSMYRRGENLVFNIFDYDRGSASDLLGMTVLPGEAFDREGGFEGELPLMGKGPPGSVTVRVEVLPPLMEAAPPISEVGSRVLLVIVGAEGLRAADWGGKSDPYCVAQFANRPEIKVKTKVIKKTLMPIWQEEHVLDEFDRGDDLEFTVFDHDAVGDHDMLGQGLLASGAFDREGGFDGEIALMGAGKGKKAKLKIQASILPPIYPFATPISEVGSRLRVSVISASGLRAADWSLRGPGKSDPFCAVFLQGKPSTKVQTRHISKTLEPVWDEEHEIADYDTGDPLVFEVYDHDRGPSAADLLGRVQLPSRAFDKEGGFDGEVELKDSGKEPPAKLRMKIEVLPAGLLPRAPPIAVPGCRLRVHFRGAKGLRAADISFLGGGKSDPYCVCHFRSQPDFKLKTKTIEKCLAPEWNEEQELDFFELGDPLEFTVYDHDRVGAHDLLGRYTLVSGDFDREGGFDGELLLRDCGKGPPASLSVAVEVLPPSSPDAPPVSEAGCTLLVQIVGAKNLRAADWSLLGGGKSDPYCCCEIKDKPDTKVRTRHIAKTLAPRWDEEHEVVDFERGDNLLFSVWDHDMAGSPDPLGKVLLAGREFDREGGFTGELKLRDAGGSGKSTAQAPALIVSVKVVNPPPAAPPVSQPGSRLRMKMIRAAGLRAADWGFRGASSDPYCKFTILGKPDTEIKSKVIKRNLNPVWNQDFDMPGYQRGDSLLFEVLDEDALGSDDLLGKVVVPPRHFDKKGGFEGTLKLRGPGAGPPGTLTLRLEVLPPLRPVGEAEPGCTVRVFVRGARGLKACAGAPDAFVVCQVRGRPETKHQTKVAIKSGDPAWNEEFRLFGYKVGDRLEFGVFDFDMGAEADLLGTACLESPEFHEEGFDGELELRDGRPNQEAALCVKVEVLPPGRFPIVVSLGSLLPVMKGDSDELISWVCHVHPVGRPNYGTVSEPCVVPASTSAPDWQEELELPEYVEGDMLEFKVTQARQGSEGEPQLFGVGVLASESVRSQSGFNGEVKLSDKRAGRVGSLKLRVESHFRWELRLDEEEKARHQREERARADEKRRRELEEAQRKRLQEEEDERLRKEQARLEAQMLAIRAENLKRDAVVPVLMWPSGEVLTQVVIVAGATVLELARRVGKAAKLPLRPALRKGDVELRPSQILLDLGVLEPRCGLYAECRPAAVTCSEDGTARIWDVTSGECELTFGGHDAAVNWACCTPDLKWLATASADFTAKLWIVEGVLQTITAACTLEGHTGAVLSVAFSQDVRYVATASADCTAKIWSVKSGQCLQTLDGHLDAVLTATFSSDGKFVTTTSKDGSTKTWEVSSGRLKSSSSEEDTTPANFAFSADGSMFLAAVGSDVEVRALQSGGLLQTLRGHTGGVVWTSFLALRAPQASTPSAMQLQIIRNTTFADQARLMGASPLGAGAALVLGGGAESRSSSAPCPRSRGGKSTGSSKTGRPRAGARGR